ncbi:hypothetical protein ACSDR0_42595 [Streptosporangium sp. G11]|uniref:hypothetical protein n=1 Tax=Streptosporangium sp. G11 TaxID=3436926 RepID=UPI003EBFCCAF
MSERNAPGASDARWTLGFGSLVIVALTCAMFGTFIDIIPVARAQHYCLGDPSAGEGFAGFVWATSRLAVFPIVSGVSAIATLMINLLIRLPCFVGHGWLKVILLVLVILISIVGPMAMILYDFATGGTPGGCVPPWWLSWLPA